MLYTSAEANKLLRSLKDEMDTEDRRERENYIYQAALGEDIESVRPPYDFAVTNARLQEIGSKIAAVKHAINLFNVKTTVVDGITIDMALVMLPQLQRRKTMLDAMRVLPKMKRNQLYGNGRANVIDYTYANFSPDDAEEEYKRVSAEIDRIQLALDRVNTTEKMEIDI